ncbi:bacillithiol system redox-active protein YtxJ [Mucilaginibacter sp. RS28]|uniref:Bacillithiol system redox-active protein YtxJ n=1 Tax=Mucilaginibacter straminoryzae TaxID=2932774 RepID=A0A9X1X6R1_9SPHI|nr:bacillithiol system redox-active protein YtxJ [Mucilaginibacter straminoryzae]MCJ8211385.1 bacillithiol system redox-active protein YtxJ [Mucilaginibacter straminoryzae]
MKWIPLESAEQLKEIKQQAGYSIIFKHSTRCSISMMARRRFEMDWGDFPENLPLYFLDLIKFRSLSNQVAEDFQVHHESPQMLLIKEGECILDQSHGAISVEEALTMVQ